MHSKASTCRTREVTVLWQNQSLGTLMANLMKTEITCKLHTAAESNTQIPGRPQKRSLKYWNMMIFNAIQSPYSIVCTSYITACIELHNWEHDRHEKYFITAFYRKFTLNFARHVYLTNCNALKPMQLFRKKQKYANKICQKLLVKG